MYAYMNVLCLNEHMYVSMNVRIYAYIFMYIFMYMFLCTIIDVSTYRARRENVMQRLLLSQTNEDTVRMTKVKVRRKTDLLPPWIRIRVSVSQENDAIVPG